MAAATASTDMTPAWHADGGETDEWDSGVAMAVGCRWAGRSGPGPESTISF
jgi:hypothetical protein